MTILQTGTTVTDQMDLLREQIKMLAGEVAFCISSLKRLSEQAANKPEDIQLQVSFLFKIDKHRTLLIFHNKTGRIILVIMTGGHA